MSYTHFTLDERKYLQKLLAEGLSIRKIAAILERSPSSISREIHRNRTKSYPKHKPDNKYWYNHWRAETLTRARRRGKRCAAIQPGTEAWNFVVRGLKLYWSPEAICGRWHKEHPEEKSLAFSTIYRYVKTGRFPGIMSKKHLRRRGKRRISKKSPFNTIHPDRIIPQWPPEIAGRARIGDWEGDTVYGGVGKGALVTLDDRKSRYLRMGKIGSRNSTETRTVIERLLDGLPADSISLDNGSEFSEFRKLEENLHTLVYFAEPHKPWQRGTNENTNDIIRFFFPKGFDFRTVTDEDIQFVEDLINNRPRKCLGWSTPAEVFFEKSVALD